MPEPEITGEPTILQQIIQKGAQGGVAPNISNPPVNPTGADPVIPNVTESDLKQQFEKNEKQVAEALSVLYKSGQRTEAELERIKTDAIVEFKKNNLDTHALLEQLKASMQAKHDDLQNKFLKSSLGYNSRDAENKNFIDSARHYMKTGELNLTQKSSYMTKTGGVISIGNAVINGFGISQEAIMEQVGIKEVSSNLELLCNRQYINTNAARVPIALRGQGRSFWAQEGQSVTGKNTFGTINVDMMLNALQNRFEVSQEYLEAAVNPEMYIFQENVRNDRRAMSDAILSGTGQGQPLGLFNCLDTSGTGQDKFKVYETKANKLEILDLRKLWAGSGIGPYRVDSRWYMGTNALSRLRFEQGQNGQFKWTTDIREGTPLQLNGQPVVEIWEMESLDPGEIAVFYGDLRSAYTIIENPNSYFVRDPNTLVSARRVAFTFFRFIDAKPIDRAALNFLKMKV